MHRRHIVALLAIAGHLAVSPLAELTHTENIAYGRTGSIGKADRHCAACQLHRDRNAVDPVSEMEMVDLPFMRADDTAAPSGCPCSRLTTQFSRGPPAV